MRRTLLITLGMLLVLSTSPRVYAQDEDLFEETDEDQRVHVEDNQYAASGDGSENQEIPAGNQPEMTEVSKN